MPEHRLIDADTHVNEPPGLWVDRVPSRYADLVPRVQRFEQGVVRLGAARPQPAGGDQRRAQQAQLRRPRLRGGGERGQA